MDNPSNIKKDFSISDTLSEGWRLLKKNMGNILVLEIIGLVVVFLATFLCALILQRVPYIGNTLNNFADLVIQVFVSIAAINIGLKIVDGKDFDVSSLFEKFDIGGKYFIGLILYQIAVVLGLIFFIIPGLVIMIRCGLFGFFIVEKNAGALESLKMSWNTVKGASWKFFLFQLALLLLNILGFICLLVGLFFTLPVSLFASVLVYRSLSRQTNWPEQGLGETK